LKIGVLISGRGSNLGALLAAKNRGDLPQADFRLVISNKADAPGLQLARQANVPTGVFSLRDFHRDRAAHEAAIKAALLAEGCEGLVLAGYMLLVSEDFLKAFPKGVINVHPALLPSFPGLDAQKQALEYGVKVSGCTVHFVDGGMDTGPIICQRTVPVQDDDTEDSLSARILDEEHRALVDTVSWWSQGLLHLEGRVVHRRHPRAVEAMGPHN
jgi:phosphoribosylglycinamide formyltransferase-1